jgi:hypothetical protein
LLAILLFGNYNLNLSSPPSPEGGGAITALRGLRVFRLFRLAKRWTSFRLLLMSMYRSVIQLGNFGFLVFLMVAIFALLGQVFFAGKFVFDAETGAVIAECTTEEAWGAAACAERCPNIWSWDDENCEVF